MCVGQANARAQLDFPLRVPDAIESEFAHAELGKLLKISRVQHLVLGIQIVTISWARPNRPDRLDTSFFPCVFIVSTCWKSSPLSKVFHSSASPTHEKKQRTSTQSSPSKYFSILSWKSRQLPQFFRQVCQHQWLSSTGAWGGWWEQYLAQDPSTDEHGHLHPPDEG